MLTFRMTDVTCGACGGRLFYSDDNFDSAVVRVRVVVTSFREGNLVTDVWREPDGSPAYETSYLCGDFDFSEEEGIEGDEAAEGYCCTSLMNTLTEEMSDYRGGFLEQGEIRRCLTCDSSILSGEPYVLFETGGIYINGFVRDHDEEEWALCPYCAQTLHSEVFEVWDDLSFAGENGNTCDCLERRCWRGRHKCGCGCHS